MVLTELVTNVIRHGCFSEHDDMGVEIFRSKGCLRLHVTQSGPLYDPGEIRRNPGETGGWGLLILDRLCSGWGVDVDIKGVWAELALED